MNPLAHLFDFDRRETPGDRLVFRLFEGLTVYFAVVYAWTWGAYIRRLETVVAPAGLGHYLDVSFLFGNGVSLVNAGLITALVLVGLARRWRYAYLAALILLHLQYAARFSLGKISHGSAYAGLALLALALAFIAYRDPQHVRRFAIGFSLFFFGFGYVTAAVSKLIGTGLTWVDGRHLWMWLNERGLDVLSETGRYAPNVVQQLALDVYPLATAVLVFGLLTEVLGFLLWYPRTRPYIAFALIGLHMGILLSLEISFATNVAYLLVLGFPWPRWIGSTSGQHRSMGPLARQRLR